MKNILKIVAAIILVANTVQAQTAYSTTFIGDGTILSSTPSTVGVTSSALTASLATQTANTVLGALTATTPSGLVMPSCSASTSALTWTSGTGFGCHTIAGGVSSFTGDGTIINNSASTGAVTATLVNAAANSILGNNTGSAAAPAYQTSLNISGSATASTHIPTSSTPPADGLYLPASHTSGIADQSLPVIETTGVASATDYLLITNAAAANPANIILTPTGSDANIGINIPIKGAAFFTITGSGSGSGGSDQQMLKVTSNNSSGTGIEIDSTASGGHDWYLTANASGATTSGGISWFDNTGNTTPFAFSDTLFTMKAGEIFCWTAQTIYTNLTCDTGISRDSAGVFDFGTGASASKAGTINAATINQNGSQVYSVAGTGLSASASTINSNAEWQAAFQPGLLTAVTNTIGGYSKVAKTSTVDNMIASALLLTCATNPTVTFYECGTSTTCVSPTTIASVQVTASGTATPATISSSTITAGDYIGWAISGGTCTSVDISAIAQIHSN